MTSNVEIRIATGDDVEHVLPLARDMATSFFVQTDQFRSTFAELMERDDALVFVAEEQGDVVGYLLGFDHLSFYANGRVSYVEELAVSADRRGQGIGQHMLEAFEGWAKTRSSTLVTVATRRAAPFYAALDYEETAILFRKVL